MSGWNSPVEAYSAHDSRRVHKKPTAGMTSKDLHRHDNMREKPVNPQLMECTEYLLWTLHNQKDPLLGHGRQALEMLVADTGGYNALPGQQHKKNDMNRIGCEHAHREAALKKSFSHKLPPSKYPERIQYSSTRTPRTDYSEPVASDVSQRLSLRGNYRLSAEKDPMSIPLKKDPFRDGKEWVKELKRQEEQAKRGSRGSGQRAKSARASGGRPDTAPSMVSTRMTAPSEMQSEMGSKAMSEAAQMLYRPRTSGSRSSGERRSSDMRRAQSARAASSRYTQTSFSDRTMSDSSATRLKPYR